MTTGNKQATMRILGLLTLLTTSSSFLQSSRQPFFTRLSLSPEESVESFFSEEFAEQLAKDVAATVKLPLVPSPVVKYTLAQAISKLGTSDVSKDSMERLQEILQTEATKSTLDDVPEAEVNDLADQISRELNPLIDIPILDEEQELMVLQQIMRVVFAAITTNDKEKRKLFVKASVGASTDLLGDASSRRNLVEAINAAVDVPILNEQQETSLIQIAVDASSGVIKTLLPEDIIETLKGENPQTIANMKEFVIKTVNEKVDLVGLDEDQERKVIETLVNILIDQYVDDTEAEFLLLTADGQTALLEEKKETLQRKKVLSERRYEREQLTLNMKLDRIEQRLKKARRSRSFFRRLFRRGG